MKKISLFLGFTAVLSSLLTVYFLGLNQSEVQTSTFSTTEWIKKQKQKFPKEKRIKESIEYFRKMTADPTTGEIPYNQLYKALKYTLGVQQNMVSKSPIDQARWKERGPKNVGGRTRAILIDANDPTGKTVITAGVSGGIWRTTDITSTDPQWDNIDDFMEVLTVSCIAQDPIDKKVIYAGTGELAGGMPGWGVFKSTDSGLSWIQLANTANNNSFNNTQKIVVDSKQHIYAATQNGVYKSTDGGANWYEVLNTADGTSDNTFLDADIDKNGAIYVSTNRQIWRSPAGNNSGERGSWQNITLSGSGFVGSASITVFDVYAQDPTIIVAATGIGGDGNGIFRTSNGGQSWESFILPTALGMNNFCRGQAEYDLDIAIDPFNPNNVIVGGIDLHASSNGGRNWKQISQWAGQQQYQYVHADQHAIVYDKNRRNVVYFGNDGGIWISVNGGLEIKDRNWGYNVTQFYACAMHPDTFSNYFLAGAQDNGSHQFIQPGISETNEVLGGDGFTCHIDQDNPAIQIASIYGGAFAISMNGGRGFDNGVNTNGSFYSLSDYDSRSNILYAETYNGSYYRYEVGGTIDGAVNVSGVNPGSVNSIKVDDNVPNRIYIGTSGRIIRVDNADTNPTATSFSVGVGVISGIDIEKNNPQHLLVSISNYNVVSVYESKDGGQSWINVEGNLPNMPVYTCLFNPKDPSQALVGTELGVWASTKLDGSNTSWTPPVGGKGTPLVRSTLLQHRNSDDMIAVSTYGRGLFTSDVFSSPRVKLQVRPIHYTNSNLTFYGSGSLGADTYSWLFGDGNSSTNEDVIHQYAQAGTYAASLTINGTQTQSAAVKILPDRGIPYIPNTSNYSGSFEINTGDYGVETISGTPFERGNSTILGKSGTNTGANAYVLGLNNTSYQSNTHTILYLPNFTLPASGLFEFSFWAKWRFDNGKDGFQIQYSTNRGQSWSVLGAYNANDANWYNSQGAAGTAFRTSPFFSGNKNQFTKFKTNISRLAGNTVAFRVVFKSDDLANYAGMVIDDVEISQYEGELKTALIDFKGGWDPNVSNEIKLSWSTYPEYYCKGFKIFKSDNGYNFDSLVYVSSSVPEGLSASQVDYIDRAVLQGASKDLYFFRMLVESQHPVTQEKYNFYSNILTIRRNIEGDGVFTGFPSDFGDHITVGFNNVINDDVTLELFDMAGRLIANVSGKVNGTYAELPTPDVARGAYVLRVKIGANKPYTQKVIKLKK